MQAAKDLHSCLQMEILNFLVQQWAEFFIDLGDISVTTCCGIRVAAVIPLSSIQHGPGTMNMVSTLDRTPSGGVYVCATAHLYRCNLVLIVSEHS